MEITEDVKLGSLGLPVFFLLMGGGWEGKLGVESGRIAVIN